MTVTGGDPLALARAAGRGADEVVAVRGSIDRVVSAAAWVRATTWPPLHLPMQEIAAGTLRWCELASMFDRRMTDVARALRVADHWPPVVTRHRVAALLTRPARAPRQHGHPQDPWSASRGEHTSVASWSDVELRVVGGAPDVPTTLRDAVHREAIRRHVAELRARVADDHAVHAALPWWERAARAVDRALDDHLLDPLGPVADLGAEAGDDRTRALAQLATLEGVLGDPSWTVLAFRSDAGGPDGDPLLRLALGDLDRASAIGVFVPGTDSGVARSAVAMRDARALHAATRTAERSDVATVLELHDAPDGLAAAAGTAHAGAAATELAAAVGALRVDAPPGRRITVVGHSHGAVVAGQAARGGLDADALLLLGAPGAGFAHVDELRLRPGATTWAARTDDDPVRLVPVLPRVVPALPPTWRDVLAPSLPGPHGPHGPDPTDPSVGAATFPLDHRDLDHPDEPSLAGPALRGHLDYLAPGTLALRNVASIVRTGAPADT